jgi:hypothetical protein
LPIKLLFCRHNFFCAFDNDHLTYNLKGLPEETLVEDEMYYLSKERTNIMEITLIGYLGENIIVFNSTHFLLKDKSHKEIGIAANELEDFKPGKFVWQLKKFAHENYAVNISLKLSNVSFFCNFQV